MCQHAVVWELNIIAVTMNTADIPFDLPLIAAAVDATNISFIISDHTAEDDPIIFCNNAFERLTGYSRQEILGRNCRFLQGKERGQPGLETLRHALQEGKNCTLVLRNYRKDGRPFDNELVVSPVKSADGSVTHFIGIQRDIRQAAPQPKLPETFHHEWRTPLTIIKSTLQILQQRGLTLDPEFLNRSLETAIRAIDRLESLGQRAE